MKCRPKMTQSLKTTAMVMVFLTILPLISSNRGLASRSTTRSPHRTVFNSLAAGPPKNPDLFSMSRANLLDHDLRNKKNPSSHVMHEGSGDAMEGSGDYDHNPDEEDDEEEEDDEDYDDDTLHEPKIVSSSTTTSSPKSTSSTPRPGSGFSVTSYPTHYSVTPSTNHDDKDDKTTIEDDEDYEDEDDDYEDEDEDLPTGHGQPPSSTSKVTEGYPSTPSSTSISFSDIISRSSTAYPDDPSSASPSSTTTETSSTERTLPEKPGSNNKPSPPQIDPIDSEEDEDDDDDDFDDNTSHGKPHSPSTSPPAKIPPSNHIPDLDKGDPPRIPSGSDNNNEDNNVLILGRKSPERRLYVFSDRPELLVCKF